MGLENLDQLPSARWINEGRAVDLLFDALWKNSDNYVGRAYIFAALSLAEMNKHDDDERRKLYHKIATERRHTVLSELSGCKFTDGSLRVLDRTLPECLEREDWIALLKMASGKDRRRAINHLPTISSTMIKQFSMIPTIFYHPPLLEILNHLLVKNRTWRMIANALSALPENHIATIARKARRARSVSDFWDLCFTCLRMADDNRPFDPPPPYLHERLEPLGTARAMRAEGKTMRHCIAQYIEASRIGANFYYHRSGLWPLTLEIVRHKSGWRIGRLAGPNNTAIPETDHRAAVHEAKQGLRALAPSPADSKQFASGYPCIAVARRIGRSCFEETMLRKVEKAIRWIRYHSRTSGENAYCILEIGETNDHNLFYIQFLSYGGTGSTILSEIQSHRYEPLIEQKLNDRFAMFLHRCGYDWPIGIANFSRVFIINSNEHCLPLAEFALGLLRVIFGASADTPIRIITECN